MQNRNETVTAEEKQVASPNQLQETSEQVLAKEAIMNELHEVTRQYLSCADPVEAAARRQRVQYTDAEGLMETTAASILAASTKGHPQLQQAPGNLSNPVTPPPLQDPVLQALIYPAPLVLYPPSIIEEESGENQYTKDDTPPATNHQDQEAEGSQRLRSIIVSPQVEDRDTPLALRTPPELRDDDETLRNFQDRVTIRSKQTKRTSPARATPNILRGASSKKRNISQLRSSPAGQNKVVSRKKQKRTEAI
ncbi:Uncharacterized protein Rs2_29880 [Raphanus sativus]|nr:Uncharacterized protein Rs2_29880 [Raphanus sativus]